MEMMFHEALDMIRTRCVMLRDLTDSENPIVSNMSIQNAHKMDNILVNNRGIYQIDSETTLICYNRKGE